MPIEVKNWFYHPDYHSPCLLMESKTLWGKTIYTVWLPDENKIVQIAADKLLPISDASQWNEHWIVYITAAARIAEALARNPLSGNEGVLLAPIESSVIPLPHQIRALSRALSGDRIRYLLADEVGLGKTIEAGLIMQELKLRGLVKRVLVIAPKGLVTQWVAEMQLHFNEHFRLILPEDLKTLQRLVSAANPNQQLDVSGASVSSPWQLFDQVIVPMDSVKPIDRRRRWTGDRVANYNRERFEDLISAGWDLIIVDEAHRLGGSTDQVARYKLGQGLAKAAPYLLLLSATPHQGKTDAFHRLISLLDEQAFPDVQSVNRERVQPYVIRTEKRQAIDAEGKPLFKPRLTETIPIRWEDKHQAQRSLYHAVTEYVREGYNHAIAKKQNYIGFLMLLMQRLVVSSTRAIRTTLERRLEVLRSPQEQLNLFPMILEEEWIELDGQEQLETLLSTRLRALKNERDEVKLLLEAARRCEQTGSDAKAEALLDWIYRLQAQEGDPELKILIFTEFIPTQEMLYEFLTAREFTVVCLNGSLSMEERKRVQDAFATEARILISTDAGGEGLNLQFCHVVINYDIPWNPMRLEQRIGRVDRIGQTHPVRAINFVLEESVEYRVLEVLEQKLAIIFEELGIDKTADVLDSAQAEQIFDDLYKEALLNPEAIESRVDQVMDSLREQFRLFRESTSVLGSAENLTPEEVQKHLTHPFPYWVERMTVSYLKAQGGHVERINDSWKLTWPNGEVWDRVVFNNKEAIVNPKNRHVNLSNEKIFTLVQKLPQFIPGQRIPVITLPELSQEIKGVWSLWQIALLPGGSADPPTDWKHKRFMALFLLDDGKVLIPTAKHIWDLLLTTTPVVKHYLEEDISRQLYQDLYSKAELHGRIHFEELISQHKTYLDKEKQKIEYAFRSRRSAIEQIGLPQVRDHRLKLLLQEEQKAKEALEQQVEILPELKPLLLLRIEDQTNEVPHG